MPKGTSKNSEPFWKRKVCENSDSGKMQYIGYTFQNISAPDLMLNQKQGDIITVFLSDHIIEVTLDLPAFAKVRGKNCWWIKNEIMMNSWTTFKKPKEFDFLSHTKCLLDIFISVQSSNLKLSFLVAVGQKFPSEDFDIFCLFPLKTPTPEMLIDFGN